MRRRDFLLSSVGLLTFVKLLASDSAQCEKWKCTVVSRLSEAEEIALRVFDIFCEYKDKIEDIDTLAFDIPDYSPYGCPSNSVIVLFFDSKYISHVLKDRFPIGKKLNVCDSVSSIFKKNGIKIRTVLDG